MKKRWSAKMLAEGGILIALSLLLSYIKIYTAPNGGSVTAGSMIPIMIFAIRWGIVPGIFIGATYGILDFILKPFFYNPFQFLLDYPIAFGLLGLAGLAYSSRKEGTRGYSTLLMGIFLAIGGRMIAHVLSGVIFFASYAGNQNPWIYSLGYNATYLVPEFIISVVIISLIWKPIKNIVTSKNA